ncbi:MAG TPA: lysophospholipid acyltransferase family protein [Candidatus Angelobacter sp.]|nr:lysophospholipid acyltransferase family protein [Candidatus Angelobacter sp.]
MSNTSSQPGAAPAVPRRIPIWLSRLRSYLFWDLLIWSYTIVLGCLSLLSSFFDKDGRIQHGFARLWSGMILGTIGAQVQVEGLERIDTSKAHIYAVNHLSALDIPVLYKHLPFQFRILAKKELFRYPFMGWHLRRSGQISVDQQNVRSSVRSIGRAVESLRANMPVVIFPEGGRSEDGHLQAFMSGAFYLAIKAQVDIVPMALVGTFEALPMSSFHIQPRPIYLRMGEPIATAGMNLRNMEVLAERTREAIADLYYPGASVPDKRVQYLERKESEK